MKMKIAILLGSVRAARRTHLIAYYIERLLKEEGHEPSMIDLASHPLPMMDQNENSSATDMEEIAQVGNILKEADGILLVTPEYHGSFSGVLKNALDFYWREFARKPIGVITTGSGKMGGINASSQLQHVILSLGAYPIPVKLLVSEIQQAFNENGEPAREDVIKFSRKFLDEFIWFLTAIVRHKQA